MEKVDENAPGTDQNPVVVDARMLMPRARSAVPAAASAAGESAFTLSAVVTREGRLLNLEWHSSGYSKAGREREAVDTLLTTASLARFEPARMQGLPVAVNREEKSARGEHHGARSQGHAGDASHRRSARCQPAPRKRRVDVVLPAPPRRSSIA